jgi:2-oxoglutarate ferredoxin oxidoreductase subunit gamma
METSVIMSGFGGQGVLLIGNLLAQTAMNEGKEVAYMPSYGVEMRGGAAMCTVVISDSAKGGVTSPVVGRPDTLIAFTGPALEKFGGRVRNGGLLILNTSMAPLSNVSRNDIKLIGVNLREEAESINVPRGINMIALGIYLAQTRIVKIENIEETFPEVIAEKYHKLIPSNMEAVRRGMEIGSRFKENDE